jgi:outer membrane receptor protein involved in Fe transport
MSAHKARRGTVRSSSPAGRTVHAACCALLAGAACVSANAAADPTELSLEQLLDLDVQSASKFIQKASEAPSSVTVVSAADIRRFGYRKLADILNSIRGLYVHYDRNYNYLGVRGYAPLGSYNSGVLVMVDGYRLNDPIYGQGSIGMEFPVDVDLIERVEFVPGPGSAIYGSNAFFGVINVITRTGKTVGGLEASAEAGSWDTYKGRLTWGRRYSSDLDLLVSLSGYSSRGRDQYYAEFDGLDGSDGVAHGLDYERAPDAFGKITWGGFTLEGAYHVRTKGIPTANFGSVFNPDPGAQTRDAQNFAELRYEGNVARDLDLTARINRGAYSYRGRFPFEVAPNDALATNLDLADSHWWGGEVKLLSRKFSGHKIVLGAEYLKNTRKDQKNYNVESGKVYLDQSHRSSQAGLYLQDEWMLRPDLVLNAGLRHDHYGTFGSITNPRLGLIYSVTPALTLKALYGNAYRAPTDGELFFSSLPAGWKSNDKLNPERINTQELVAEWRLSSLTRATLSAFRNRISDLVMLTTDDEDGLQVYRNAGTARVRGLQGEYEALWRNGGAVRASYSFQQAHDENGARLVNSPRHLAKLDGTRPLFGDALRAGLVLRYVGSRLTRSAAQASAYTTADLVLSSERLLAGAELSLGIYNLFDKAYSDPVSDSHLQDTLKQDGRSIRLKLTAHF